MKNEKEFLDYLTDPVQYNLFESLILIVKSFECVHNIKYLERKDFSESGRYWYVTFYMNHNPDKDEIDFQAAAEAILADRNNLVGFNTMPFLHDEDMIHGSIIVQ